MKMQRRSWVTFGTVGRALAIAVVGLWMTACATVPSTGEKAFILISPEQELRLGAEAAPQFKDAYGGEIPSASVRNYVREIGMKLAAVSESPDLPWEFYSVDSSVINAFALPGGKVFVTRGILQEMDSEAELAAVLGHEIGHVTSRHSAQQISRQLAAQVIIAGIGIAGEVRDDDALRTIGVGAQAGSTLYLLKFGRDHEDQSDELGVRYMTKLGYNPEGMIDLMETLAAQGNSNTVEFLSTHPLPRNRIENIRETLDVAYPFRNDPTSGLRVGKDTYKLRVLDPLKRLPPPKHQP